MVALFVCVYVGEYEHPGVSKQCMPLFNNGKRFDGMFIISYHDFPTVEMGLKHDMYNTDKICYLYT